MADFVEWINNVSFGRYVVYVLIVCVVILLIFSLFSLLADKGEGDFRHLLLKILFGGLATFIVTAIVVWLEVTNYSVFS